MKRTIVISINTAWNIYNFRSGLIKALIAKGYDVVALAPDDSYSERLKSMGCRFVALPMDNNGTNPFRDTALLAQYYWLLRSLRPDAFLGYTVKPNVYGSLAAHALGIPVINNIAGLGATFINNSFVTKIVRRLYRLSLRRSYRVFFQNPDDQALFVKSGLVDAKRSALLPGSGIDLLHYTPLVPSVRHERSFRFLLVARMLKDKGVEEFVAAARLVREKHPDVEFQLLGSIDAANPNAIPAQRISAWQDEGLVAYLGRTDDVRPFLAEADCVVLPSYREGVPRSLLEAAAMARPLIATEVVGCREAVDDQVNGFLCEVKNPASLAEKMMAMLAMPPAQRGAMGLAGRVKVENEFDEQIVTQKYLQALDGIVQIAPASEELGGLVPERPKP